MMRVLVTGAAGLLGQHLINFARSKRPQNKYSVLAIDVAPGPFEESGDLTYIQYDLTDYGGVRPVIMKFSPHLIFNCASYNDVDGCEKNRVRADEINVEIVENLCRLDKVRIIHFSSDYIFNGNDGPYSEDDIPEPICYYGATKLASERIILESGGDHLIVRSNVLYGAGKGIRPNFITWLVQTLRLGEKVRIAADQFNNPTHAGNLAEASLEASVKDCGRILHIAGSDYLSRYDVALKAAGIFDLDSDLIEPVTTDKLRQIARRPLKAGLKIEKARKILKTRLMGLDEGLSFLKDVWNSSGGISSDRQRQ